MEAWRGDIHDELVLAHGAGCLEWPAVSASLLATMLRAHDPAEIWLAKVSTRPDEDAVGAG
ncbi:hypothetical protein [Acetobacter sp. UBA5411]|uniref:hypothetical protein n=1 Tax=Acetobacter sp. UBA5411 TaxID=1945905 RepID=UPI0025BFC7F0|nr:hypothetical protein [Acetobacter sp. UBA5411]